MKNSFYSYKARLSKMTWKMNVGESQEQNKPKEFKIESD